MSCLCDRSIEGVPEWLLDSGAGPGTTDLSLRWQTSSLLAGGRRPRPLPPLCSLPGWPHLLPTAAQGGAETGSRDSRTLSLSWGAGAVSGARALFWVAGPSWDGRTCPTGLPRASLLSPSQGAQQTWVLSHWPTYCHVTWGGTASSRASASSSVDHWALMSLERLGREDLKGRGTRRSPLQTLVMPGRGGLSFHDGDVVALSSYEAPPTPALPALPGGGC